MWYWTRPIVRKTSLVVAGAVPAALLAWELSFALSSPMTDCDQGTKKRKTDNKKKTDQKKQTKKEETSTNSNSMSQSMCDWDYNWDKKAPVRAQTAEQIQDLDTFKSLKTGTTRHIILIRHGQYDETSKYDSERLLTPLGRKQAKRTGQRLAELIQGGTTKYPCGVSSPNMEDPHPGTGYALPCPVTKVYVSDLTRAKETAEIIVNEMKFYQKDVHIEPSDRDLNEDFPAVPIVPIRPDVGDVEEMEDGKKQRMEKAFQKYIYRGPISAEGESKDEFIIIIGHGNVIRYFFLRALQFPPSAWLRLCIFNCSLSYLVIRPNGYVTARLLGDVGHIPYDEVSFSGSHGFACLQ